VSGVKLSSKVLHRFVETVAAELGTDQFKAVMSLSRLPPEWTKPESFLSMSPIDSAKAYASIQAAMRTYYGRGARGVLVRVGQHMWGYLLEDAAFGNKAQAALIKRLPLSMRRKSILELLAKFIGLDSGDITIHTLDLDLLLADHTSPTADGQAAPVPICFVTQGLIRESLLWATGRDHDVEETSCKATGRDACEFTITVGK
jgi:predicted hydrocarbon binding protein